MQVPLKLFLATALTAGSLTAHVGLTAQQPTTRCDPPAGSLSSLTRAQKKAFTESQNTFIANRYADALGELRNLLAQLPPNTPAQSAMAERTAEAALYAGERTYAISLLKPIEERDASDCPARTLLARAYAEEGQSAERDAETSALTVLHKQAPESTIGKLDAFLLEQHGLKGGGAVTIAYVLRPWGPHNTHLFSEIYNASGKMIFHIELDSDDSDQVYFREIHPDLAAKGDRRFSLDAVRPDPLPDGTVDHALIQFYDGAPSYDTVRERILAIAERSAKPAS
ncbi:MAG: hypothetical protein P4L26_00060 [Terracidiphilus sp.]|nr:hypothetical protein [Terracidiphilus sp.]